MSKSKTLHEQLGITFQELGALLGTRNMLASGILQMDYDGEDVRSDNKEQHNCHLFNMNKSGEINEHCGSVGCIGGTMAMIMGLKSFNEINAYVTGAYDYYDFPDRTPLMRSTSLEKLFYPSRIDVECWDVITREQAVQAIDNWINSRGGNPQWDEITAE